MKKYLLALLLITNVSWAQNSPWREIEITSLCGPFQEIVVTLQKNQYQETPLWIGQSSEDTSRYALFFNEKKGNWTLVRYLNNTGCVLGIGRASEVVNPTAGQSKIH